jgi:tetratricopeptide (TPR) repeat protein
MVGVAGLALLFLAGAVQLQAARERVFPAPPPGQDTVYITSGTAVRRLSVAFTGVAADLYWIRAIQYYGGTKRRLAERPQGPAPPPMLAVAESDEFSQLYALLDITTTLDPLFDIAYRFGAVFLAEAYPSGAGRVDLAVKLLEKGIAARPDKWEYMQDIGFVYYWYAHDYREAAARFKKAGEVPGAPNWLEPLAATTLARGGDRETSRTMWRSIRDTADVDWLRSSADRLLLQLDALDQMDNLQSKLDAFAQARGAPAADWGTVIRARVLPGVPLDPSGAAYELTPDGRVQLSRSSSLFPLPAEPQRAGLPS